MGFIEIKPEQWNENPFVRIGQDWMLVSAGSKEKINTMTASWGGVGVLWNDNVSFIFIRPSRYTLQFVEKNDYYSLSFFDDSFRDVLNFCGKESGRTMDKVKECGLHPIYRFNAPFFEEASTVLICKKMYFQDLEPSGFISESIKEQYPNKDYHRVFVGRIEKIYIKERK